jgi:hypothetical protein
MERIPEPIEVKERFRVIANVLNEKEWAITTGGLLKGTPVKFAVANTVLDKNVPMNAKLPHISGRILVFEEHDDVPCGIDHPFIGLIEKVFEALDNQPAEVLDHYRQEQTLNPPIETRRDGGCNVCGSPKVKGYCPRCIAN